MRLFLASCVAASVVQQLAATAGSFDLHAMRSCLDPLTGEEEVQLRNSDFHRGTYKIVSQGIYTLQEDIVMEPHGYCEEDAQEYCTHMLPLPHSIDYLPEKGFWLGFFAAIAVGADNVVIDLNGHSLGMSVEFSLRQRFFTLIELADKPFKAQTGPPQFNALETEARPATCVVVTNGTLGLTSHMGLHGNDMKNIWLHDLTIRDFETGGVQFNGASNVVVTSVHVGPSLGHAASSHQVPALATLSQATLLLRIVEMEDHDHSSDVAFTDLRDDVEGFISSFMHLHSALTSSVVIVEGQMCHGDDCASVADCPAGSYVIRCESTSRNNDGAIMEGGTRCVAYTNTKALAVCARTNTKALVGCSRAMAATVQSSSAMFLDQQEVSATCPSGTRAISCNCESAWGIGSNCEGEAAFTPDDMTTCSRTVPKSQGRRRGNGVGAGSKVSALCAEGDLFAVSGAECSGDDCESTAVCPEGSHLVKCESFGGVDGAYIEDGTHGTKCVATTNARAIATCSTKISTSVVASGTVFQDSQEVTATCPSGTRAVSCNCWSAWEIDSNCEGQATFAPQGNTCSRTVPQSAGRRRSRGRGAGSKVYALCSGGPASIYDDPNLGFAGLPDGSAIYGMLFHKSGPAVHDFGACAAADGEEETEVAGGAIRIEDVTIEGLALKSDEVIAMVVIDSSGEETQERTVTGPAGDVVQLLLAQDADGKYVPNKLTEAQRRLMQLRSMGGHGDDEFALFGSTYIPAEIEAWMAQPQEINFLDTVEKIKSDRSVDFRCEKDSMGHHSKGTVGLRLEFVQDVSVVDVHISDLTNVGVRADSAGGLVTCTDSATYRGSDVRAVTLSHAHVDHFDDVRISSDLHATGAVFEVEERDGVVMPDTWTARKLEASLERGHAATVYV